MPPRQPRKPTDIGLVALLFTVGCWWLVQRDTASDTMHAMDKRVSALEARITLLESRPCSSPYLQQ
jgi:hypothetical protein